MERQVLISVVIAAYQAERTLGEALESVAGQSLGAWEALVVDDGSVDATAAVAEAWEARDARFRVLRHAGGANLGRSASRNFAVQQARGDVVAFLDADDVLEIDALARQRGALDRFSAAGFVYGRARTFGGAATRVIGRGVPGQPVDLLADLCRSNPVITSTSAVRRAALGHEPFPAGERFVVEDLPCWVDLARNHAFLFLDHVLAGYREIGGVTEGVAAAGQGPEYEVEIARNLVARLAAGTPRERDALSKGLSYRAAGCLLMSASRLRRGDARSAARWLRAGREVAGSWSCLASAVAQAPGCQLRAWRGRDVPLLALPSTSRATTSR